MIKDNIKTSILDNGLKLITCQRDTNIFSMGVGIKAGSLYEKIENSGIAHMVEHMIFKGTNNRDADKLNADIERLAGNFDIYTTYSHTAMNIDVVKEKADECMDIVSDMLINAAFPKKEFAIEKSVIIEELKMEKDDAEEQAYLGFYKKAFPEAWYKYHIGGTIKSVKAIKLDMIKEFYKNYYIPKNIIIFTASSYSHEGVLNIVEKYFNQWICDKAPSNMDSSNTMVSGKVLRRKKGISQSHIVYGFNIKMLNKREEAVLALINRKLGSGGNSILFKELRDKKGYAYSVYSDLDFTPGIKLLNIYACVSSENLNESIRIIDNVIDGIKSGKTVISNEEIDIIREGYLTDNLISLETSSNVVDFMMDGELNYDNPKEYDEFLKDMEGVNQEEIVNVIEKVFNNPFLYILSPA